MYSRIKTLLKLSGKNTRKGCLKQGRSSSSDNLSLKWYIFKSKLCQSDLTEKKLTIFKVNCPIKSNVVDYVSCLWNVFGSFKNLQFVWCTSQNIQSEENNKKSRKSGKSLWLLQKLVVLLHLGLVISVAPFEYKTILTYVFTWSTLYLTSLF